MLGLLLVPLCASSKYAAIGIVDHSKPGYGSVQTTVGAVTKSAANPLLVQDTPWEPRIDNGYPNIVRTPNGAWELFYGTCQHGCGTQILLYANSSDGLKWDKPKLGLFDVGRIRPDLKAIGKANNIILLGGGIGVLRDESAPPSRRYVAFGPGCYEVASNGNKGCAMSWEGRMLQPRYPQQDLAFSADGLTYSDAHAIKWPSPQRYDCHNNLFHDEISGVGKGWLATTRDGFSAAPGRTIGIAPSLGDTLTFNLSAAPVNTLSGTTDSQLYSQITFKWGGIYLGIVMVYEVGSLPCIHPPTLTSPSCCIHPRFTSAHRRICSLDHPQATSKEQKVRCKLAWSPHGATHDTWQWVDAGGLTGAEFIPLSPGGAEVFDSHICFAAATPVSHGGKELLYYMGGNGPHSGARNSSLGLATMRADGYAALTANGPTGHDAGSIFTVPVLCTGPTLVATVDFAPSGGTLAIGALANPDLDASKAVPLTANSTDAPVHFQGGADFTALVGKMVTLEMRMQRASVYTVGFV